MSIQTRSTATLVARLEELQREEEEKVTELRRRASENEPENGAGHNETEANEPMQLEEEPNSDRFPEAGGGNQRTLFGHALQAELCGLTFTDSNQEAPHWQVTDWPPLPFLRRAHHASVVVNNGGTTTVVVLSTTTHNESNMVHFLQLDGSTQNLRWHVGPSMNQTRFVPTAVICRGYVYVTGDNFDTTERIDIQDLVSNSSESNSPTSNKRRGWTTLECRLSVRRFGCKAAVVKERFIVVAGGCFDSSIDILDTAASTNSASGVVIRAGPPLNVGRSYFAMEVIGSRIYAVGGSGPEEEFSSVEYLELDDWVEQQGPQCSRINSPSNNESFIWTNSWRIHPQLALDNPRYLFGMVRVRSCLVVVGGIDNDGNTLRSGQVLDTEHNSSWELPDMIEERDGCTLMAHSTGIVAIGGSERTCERLPLVDHKSACFARCLALGRAPKF